MKEHHARRKSKIAIHKHLFKMQCREVHMHYAVWSIVVRGLFYCGNVGNSACTPVPTTRNCAVDYCIAASIGVTDIRVQ